MVLLALMEEMEAVILEHMPGQLEADQAEASKLLPEQWLEADPSQLMEDLLSLFTLGVVAEPEEESRLNILQTPIPGLLLRPEEPEVRQEERGLLI
jgi:hypothetical protein